jgi:hypothetical protein
MKNLIQDIPIYFAIVLSLVWSFVSVLNTSAIMMTNGKPSAFCVVLCTATLLLIAYFLPIVKQSKN